MQGQIIRAISGFYYVKTPEGVKECKAKGKFRLEGITPLVGDYVTVEKEEDGYDVVASIGKRKNEVVRPHVANIDILLIVISAKIPKPDFLLVDKLIIEAERKTIEPVICINKCDIAKKGQIEDVEDQYRDYKILKLSALKNQGIEEIKEAVHGKISCMAGQSAVGKTSILNALCEMERETGTISKKTDRGKHTTREINLIEIDEDSMILDTPGFSVLGIEDMAPEELHEYYSEFTRCEDACYYNGCMHYKEPDCGVKAALEDGKINAARYERYIILLEELIQKEKRKYD